MRSYYVNSKEEGVFSSLFKLQEEKKKLEKQIDEIVKAIKPIKDEVVELTEGYDLIIMPDTTIYHKQFKTSPSFQTKEFNYYIFKKED